MFVSPLVVKTNTIVNAIVTVTRFLNQVLEGQRETTESVSVICENMNTSCQRRHTHSPHLPCAEKITTIEKVPVPTFIVHCWYGASCPIQDCVQQYVLAVKSDT